MATVAVRPFFFSALLYLGLAALWGVAGALGARDPIAAYPFWLLLGGFALLGLEGASYWYFPSFTKRTVGMPQVAWVVLGLQHAALLVSLVNLLPGVRMPASWAPGAPFAAAAVLFGGHLLGSFRFAAVWKSGGAMFERGGRHSRGDAFAAAAFLVGLVGLAASGLILVAAPYGRVLGGLLALLLGALFPMLAAWTAFLLPRNAKRTLPAPRLAWALLLFGAVGAASVVASALGDPVYGRYVQGGSLVLLAALTGAAALWAFLPYAPEQPGPLLARARPYFLVAAAATVLGAASGVAAVNGAPDALVAALPLLALGAAASTAGILLLGVPVLANQRPGPPRLGTAAAVAAVAAVAAALLPLAGVAAGWAVALASAIAAGFFVKQMEPLRKPRRACPPRRP